MFHASWLNHRLPIDAPMLRKLLHRQIDAVAANHGDDLRAQVHSMLRTSLLTRHAKAEQVAAPLLMHSRTLARRLDACGNLCQGLVDEVRFEIARQMLEGSAMEVAQIAEAFDYADPSALTRAFRRWSGTRRPDGGRSRPWPHGSCACSMPTLGPCRPSRDNRSTTTTQPLDVRYEPPQSEAGNDHPRGALPRQRPAGSRDIGPDEAVNRMRHMAGRAA